MKKIVFDLDGTLISMSHFYRAANAITGQKRSLSDHTSYDKSKCFDNEYSDALGLVYSDTDWSTSGELIIAASELRDWLNFLSNYAELYAVSYRPSQMQLATIKQLHRLNILHVFKKVIVDNSVLKINHLKSLDCDILVEDNAFTVADFHKEMPGKHSFLLATEFQPYNNPPEVHLPIECSVVDSYETLKTQLLGRI